MGVLVRIVCTSVVELCDLLECKHITLGACVNSVILNQFLFIVECALFYDGSTNSTISSFFRGYDGSSSTLYGPDSLASAYITHLSLPQ